MNPSAWIITIYMGQVRPPDELSSEWDRPIGVKGSDKQ